MQMGQLYSRVNNIYNYVKSFFKKRTQEKKNEIIIEQSKEIMNDNSNERTIESYNETCQTEINNNDDQKSLSTVDLSCNNDNKIINNLEIISKLKEGEKLWLNDDGILTIDESWFPSYTRWIHGQSKEIIMPCIVATITTASSEEYRHDENIKKILLLSINGLKNLAITYPTKENEINTLINIINT